MKKYYIGFFVLLALCVAAVVYTANQGSAAKVDKATDQAVEEFANKVGDSYDISEAPESLAAAGVKDAPSTVTYTKLSSTSYKICFDYKTAAGGFDAGWSSLLTGALSSQSGDNDNNATADYGYGYFNSDVEFNHKKGQNCQTVKVDNYAYPVTTNDDSSSSSNACYNYSADYTVVGSATVSSIDTTTKQITFSPDDQYITDDSGNSVTVTTKGYDSSTVFCSADSQVIDASAIQPGKEVYVYLESASSPTISEIELTE